MARKISTIINPVFANHFSIKVKEHYLSAEYVLVSASAKDAKGHPFKYWVVFSREGEVLAFYHKLRCSKEKTKRIVISTMPIKNVERTLVASANNVGWDMPTVCTAIENLRKICNKM